MGSVCRLALVVVTILGVAAPGAAVASASPRVPDQAPRPEDVCPSPRGSIVLSDGTVHCIAAPPNQMHHRGEAYQEEDPSGPATFTVAPVETAPVQCYGDGRDGKRVQVLYVHRSSQPSRMATLDADLRRYVGQVEWTFWASAARTGGRRHVRWVTDLGPNGGCQVALTSVAVRDEAIDDFGKTVNELRAQGFVGPNRKYLILADVDIPDFCGLASAPIDDRKVTDNAANTQVGYAYVDEGCWHTGDNGLYSTAAHELAHTLGAVQPSAPHSTEARHCYDDYDVMCYEDGPSTEMVISCRDDNARSAGQGDLNNRYLDCDGDDYYRVPAVPGSYLDAHWNVADSLFLARTASTGPGHVGGEPTYEADPQGRTMVLPSGTLGGPHRPLLPDAYGWEACTLPVELVVDRAEASSDSGGLLGVFGDEEEQPDNADADRLETLLGPAVDELERATGIDLFTMQSDGAGAPGALTAVFGSTSLRHRLDLDLADARIQSGQLTIDRDVADLDPDLRQTVMVQALAQALGIGRVGGTRDLMSPYPPADANRGVAVSALRHLYSGDCAQIDPRLDDTVAGDPTQRHLGGARTRYDIAGGTDDVIDVGTAVSRWLRQRNGDGWAAQAVVCRDDVFADCLGGAGLAGADGLVAFVPGGPDGSLPATVGDELRLAVGSGAEVFVLGGTNAVSARIEQQLRDELPGRVVTRLAGRNRFETAATVAREVDATRDAADQRVVVARGDNPADAVAVGAVAARDRLPIVLTEPDRLPNETFQAIRDMNGEQVLVMGGSSAVSTNVEGVLHQVSRSVVRLAGRSRSETAVAIARAPTLWDRVSVVDSGSVIAVNGWHPSGWALALAAAPLGAQLEAPVVYVMGDTIPSRAPSGDYPGDTLEYLRDLPVAGSAPVVASVVVGAGYFTAKAVAEEFHGSLLPGYDGNAAVRSGG